MLFFSCSMPEVKVAIPVGVLQKQVKTTEEKEKDLQEEMRKIRKKQQALGQTTVKCFRWITKCVLISQYSEANHVKV